MTKEGMVRLLKTDVQAWNRWRNREKVARIDLSGVDLSGDDLSYARLIRVHLEGANLKEANLTGSILYDVNCAKSDLRWAILNEADIRLANLSEVQLQGAFLIGTKVKMATLVRSQLCDVDLSNAILTNCDCLEADFSGATLSGTSLSDVHLSGAKGLDKVVHRGPSTVGIDTIYRSQGKISATFLRDAGVSEEFIRFIPSLIGAENGIQFYSCFISHSHEDRAFAERLFSKMRDAKLRVWYAPEEMKGGQKLHEQIETAIRVYDKLLVVLSKASMQSEWVRTEIRNARRHERKVGKRKIFPVRLVDMDTIRDWSCFDADSGKDLGVELREYFIPDFREWKDHDRFESAFTRLLRDLKSEAPPRPAA